MCLCAELSGSEAIWKHGRGFLHLFAPSGLSTAYIAVGRKGKGRGWRGGIENKLRTLNGFVRHAVCKDAARTRKILVGDGGGLDIQTSTKAHRI